MAENDWDLYAVVRGCKSAATAATGLSSYTSNTTTQNYLSCLSKFTFDEDDDAPVTFPSLVQPISTGFNELQQACIPFMGGTTTTTMNVNANSARGVDISIPKRVASVSDLVGSIARQQQPFQFGGPHLKSSIHLQRRQQYQQYQLQQQQRRQFQIAQSNINSCAVSLSNTPSQSTRARKRKSQQKRLVCHVPPDKLSSDLWAWRKYGQKPIKGSPYPRNYYRCSSSKGCGARKQVERSINDPELFIVTYTGEHTHPRPTHRNSLAGSTRTRLPSASHKADSQSFLPPGFNTEMNKNINPFSSSSTSVSPTTQATCSPPEDETQRRDMEIEVAAMVDDLLIPDRAMADEIFADFQHLQCPLPTEHNKRFVSSLGSI